MATLTNKIFVNTAGQAMLRLCEIAIGVVTLGLITRYLGQVGFGYYTTVYALLQFFIILADMGLYLTLLREISAHGDEHTEYITNNIFTLRVISSVAFIILSIGVTAMSSYPLPIKLGVIALSVNFIFSSFIATLTALFQKHLHMIKIASLNLLSKVLFLGSAIVIVVKNLGLQSIFVSYSLIAIVTFILLWRLLYRLPAPVHLKLSFQYAYWRQIVRKTWPLALTTALNLIYFKADTIILSLYHSPESVGLYGVSYRVLEIIATFPHMFMGLILPVLTAAWIAHDPERLQMVWQKAFTFFMVIALPLIAGTFIVGRPLMILIAGNDFALSGSLLKVLMLATAAIFFGTLYTYMVLVIERQKYVIKYFLATTCVSLIGYFIFIPRYSYWGAAWMTVVSEILIIIGAWLVIRRHVSLRIPWLVTAKLASASVLMAMIAWYLQRILPVIPLILVSGLVYFLLTLLTGALSIKDIRELIKS